MLFFIFLSSLVRNSYFLGYELSSYDALNVQAYVDDSSENSDNGEGDNVCEVMSDGKSQPCQEQVLFSTGTEDEDDLGDANWASLEEDSTSDKDDNVKETELT